MLIRRADECYGSEFTCGMRLSDVSSWRFLRQGDWPHDGSDGWGLLRICRQLDSEMFQLGRQESADGIECFRRFVAKAQSDCLQRFGIIFRNCGNDEPKPAIKLTSGYSWLLLQTLRKVSDERWIPAHVGSDAPKPMERTIKLARFGSEEPSIPFEILGHARYRDELPYF